MLYLPNYQRRKKGNEIKFHRYRLFQTYSLWRQRQRKTPGIVNFYNTSRRFDVSGSRFGLSDSRNVENSLTSQEYETGNLDKIGQIHRAGYHTGNASGVVQWG